MVEIFGHPFSSYTWKVLIALYENDTPFEFRMIDEEHAQNTERLCASSPQHKFPLLIQGETELFESTVIIEYLQWQFPGAVSFIPREQEAALKVRMLDRFFDNYVMTPTQSIVDDFLREPDCRDPLTVTRAKARLQRSYQWLDSYLHRSGEWACGDGFSLADCAAAPSLFYGDWVCEIPASLSVLRQYRARLLARDSIHRCVEDARPYRNLFPAGAPDRD